MEATAAHKPKIVGYARVSTRDQDCGLQRAAILKEGVAPENIYEDTVSGASEERPGFDKLMRELRAGETLVIWKLDRLSRRLPKLIEIVSTLKEMEVNLRVITQPELDTTTASGRMMFHFFGVLAEYERDVAVERTNAGLDRARSEGRHPGRKPLYSDEQIRDAMVEYMARGDWRRAASKVRVGRQQISIPNLQKRIKALQQKDRESEREQRSE